MIDAGTPVANPRVFVTSATFTGDLKTPGRSLDARIATDTLCNDAATDAGLGGVWRAMVSVGIDSAFTRIDNAPYRLIGTTTDVFRTVAMLSQVPEVPLNRNEFGTVVPISPVWTGTERSGINNGVSCGDWDNGVSDIGSGGFTHDAGAWTGAFVASCDTRARIYCFEF